MARDHVFSPGRNCRVPALDCYGAVAGFRDQACAACGRCFFCAESDCPRRLAGDPPPGSWGSSEDGGVSVGRVDGEEASGNQPAGWKPEARSGEPDHTVRRARGHLGKGSRAGRRPAGARR